MTEVIGRDGNPMGGVGATSPRVAWLFLDLNSYFASVEQEADPALRGRPVAIVPTLVDTTCCIAASYEAKAFGVKTGMQVGEAKRLCPGLILIEGRHDVYVDYHHRIVQAVESCVPVTCVLSIDEMACRLMGREQELLTAMQIARRAKAAIREHVGSTLRCSVGLAPNRYLAKIASDMEKPDGLTALTHDVLPQALLRLELRDLVGIGRRMEERLHTRGIRNMAALLACSPEQLRQAWGNIQGERLWHWLRGEDFNDPVLEVPKSMGHQHVLPPELRTVEGAYSVAQKLLHKAAMRMREARMWTGGMTLTLRFGVPGSGVLESKVGRKDDSGIPQSRIPKQSWSQGLRLVECQDTQTLIEGLQKLWEQVPKGAGHQKPFLVSVTLVDLVPDSQHTLSLFVQEDGEQHRAHVARTMDGINSKYGTHTLYFGGMHGARGAAPTRIAFSSIPDLF